QGPPPRRGSHPTSPDDLSEIDSLSLGFRPVDRRDRHRLADARGRWVGIGWERLTVAECELAVVSQYALAHGGPDSLAKKQLVRGPGQRRGPADFNDFPLDRR